MKRRFRDYDEKLLQDLKDPEVARLYLKVSFQDKDPRVFALAFKNVCEARGLKDIGQIEDLYLGFLAEQAEEDDTVHDFEDVRKKILGR